MSIQRAKLPVDLFADYHARLPESPARLFVLLHGFDQLAEKLYQKFEPYLPEQGHAILAPNGPFPIPRRTDQGYRLGCSWYFYDASRDDYYMDMSIGVKFVSELIKRLSLSHVPTTLIGFSQGGYLAPFIAQAMPQVDHVIGIGCEFLTEEMRPEIGFRMDAVHGARDEVVSAEEARLQRQKLDDRGVPGGFYLLPEGTHRVDRAILEQVASLIRI